MDTIFIKSNRSGATTTNISEAAAVMNPFWNMDYIVLTMMISVLSLVGIVGNIPVLIVYYRRKDKKVSNTFIKILAFLDLLVCTFIMPYSIIYEFHLVTSDVACRVFEIVRHFTITASNLTLVAIAVERYIAVCQIGTKINVRSINYGVGGIITVSLLMSAPSVGTFAVIEQTEVEEIPCTFLHEATTGRFCHFTYTVMDKEFVTAYQGLLMLIFFLVFVIIVVLYIIVYVVLWKKTKIRRQMNKRRESSFASETFRPKTKTCHYSRQTSSSNDKEEESSTVSANAYMPLESSSAIKSIRHETAIADLCVTDSVAKKSETKVSFLSTFNKQLQSEVVVKADANGISVKPMIKRQLQSEVVVTADANGTSVKPMINRKQINISFGEGDKKENPRKKRHYHRRTAKMLFLCTIIYFVTWLPFWFDIFRLTNSLILRYMFFIGNATNPVVYGIVNKQVRRSFKKLLHEYVRKCCKISKNSDSRDSDFDFNGSTSGGGSTLNK